MEARNPASTTLDLLLADALLGDYSAAESETVQTAEPVTTRLRLLPESTTNPSPRAERFVDNQSPTATIPSSAGEATRRVLDWPVESPTTQPVFRAVVAAGINPNSFGSVETPAIPSRDATLTSKSETVAPGPIVSYPAATGSLSLLPGSEGEGDPEAPPAPSIVVELSTVHVPVNANNTNGSAWKKVNGVDQVGIPEKRDFTVAPIPGGDPELKAVTVTVTNPHRSNALHVSITPTDPAKPGGAAVPYIDAEKTRVLGVYNTFVGGATPQSAPGGQYQYSESDIPAVYTFYLEGQAPSLDVGDITLKVDYWGYDIPNQSVVSNTVVKPFTVTPVLKEFSVNRTGDPSEATLIPHPTVQGKYVGITSKPAGRLVGVTITADLNPRTNMPGQPHVMQSVVDVNPWTMTMDPGGVVYDFFIVNGSFPILDVGTGQSSPFYEPVNYTTFNNDRVAFAGSDTPAFTIDLQATPFMNSCSIHFKAKTYVVWRYTDQIIYTLARSGCKTGLTVCRRPPKIVPTGGRPCRAGSGSGS